MIVTGGQVRTVWRVRVVACCSLRDDFNGNVAVFNVYKRHSDVIVIKLTAVLRIKFPTKCIFRIFYIWKINRMTLYCNLFIQRPSYYDDQVSLVSLVSALWCSMLVVW